MLPPRCGDQPVALRVPRHDRATARVLESSPQDAPTRGSACFRIAIAAAAGRSINGRRGSWTSSPTVLVWRPIQDGADLGQPGAVRRCTGRNNATHWPRAMRVGARGERMRPSRPSCLHEDVQAESPSGVRQETAGRGGVVPESPRESPGAVCRREEPRSRHWTARNRRCPCEVRVRGDTDP